jgi:hypothetical protein
MAKKYIVSLSAEEKETLSEIIKKNTNAVKMKRAYILLGAESGPSGKEMTDQKICDTYEVSLRTVERLRERLVLEGFDIALNGKPRDAPKPRKIDGDAEAHLIALTRMEAPTGYKQWSLRLLADKMVELGYIESLSHESVRQVLKKTN